MLKKINICVCKKCGNKTAFFSKWSTARRTWEGDEITLKEARQCEGIVPTYEFELDESDCPKCSNSKGDLPF